MSERVGSKIYVDVGATFSAEGILRPKYLIWEDGRKFEIDRITKIERGATRKGGGAGIMYLCMIWGKPVRLFYEENYRWFLEAE